MKKVVIGIAKSASALEVANDAEIANQLVKISYPKGPPKSLLNALGPEVGAYIELLERQVIILKNRVTELEMTK